MFSMILEFMSPSMHGHLDHPNLGLMLYSFHVDLRMASFQMLKAVVNGEF